MIISVANSQLPQDEHDWDVTVGEVATELITARTPAARSGCCPVSK